MKRQKREIVSFKMSRVKAKGSSIERIMSSAIWDVGLRGYRKNQKGIIGTPDFCWRRQKIAVFCDSSFWHGYNWQKEKSKIKVRKIFWFKKIEDNIKRDRVVTMRLRKEGWNVLRFWDFDIKNDPQVCVHKIISVLSSAKIKVMS